MSINPPQRLAPTDLPDGPAPECIAPEAPPALAAGWLTLLEHNTRAGCWRQDLPSGQLHWSEGLARLLAWPSAQPAAEDLLHLFTPASQPALAKALQACRTHAHAFSIELQAHTAGGQTLWVRASGQAVQNAQGEVIALEGALVDLSELKRSEQDSQRVMMQLSTTLASINEAFVTLDRTGCFSYINTESERLLQRSGSGLLGHPIWRDFGDDSGEQVRHAIENAVATGLSTELEAFYALRSVWLELRVYPFADGLAVYFRDITARKAADDEIEYLAFYDTLTQLPNRQLLMERLERALSVRSGPHGWGALMFIDLDHFKVLNDSLGHARGDLLLQQVSRRLQTCVRRSDTVARLGGDEFVVMLQDLADEPEPALAKTRAVSEKILAALREPYDVGGHLHHGTCSIGITQFRAHSGHIGDVLKQADLAMYQAKAAGRNTACFFDPEMQAAANANAALNTELRQAFHERQFVLHYQPQVGRDDCMVGVEALLRWQRPDRLVMPDAFIAQAEESGLILPLGRWVLETACQQLAAWALRPETAQLSIAVNVSVRQFRDPEFVDQVMGLIRRTGIPASRLKLELTESLLASDIEVTIAKMGMLKDAGVTLAIDDFGMGYSALSYLKHMPLDQLKIDRSFVKDLLCDPNDAAIARTIIALAQSLGLAVIAEGVETQAQRDFLSRHGCDVYQGFLFSAALPVNELEAFMQAKARAHASPA